MMWVRFYLFFGFIANNIKLGYKLIVNYVDFFNYIGQYLVV